VNNFANTLFNPLTRRFEPLPAMPREIKPLYEQARSRFFSCLDSLRAVSSKPLDAIDYKACAQIAAQDVARRDAVLRDELAALLKPLYADQT
jgi:hypothetical protein